MVRIICILSLFLSVCSVHAGSLTVEQQRTVAVDVAVSQIGVREATGKNDGKQVEAYLQSVKLGRGYPWCAAFISWVYDHAMIKHPLSGYCPHWFKSNVIYLRSSGRPLYSSGARPGDMFGIYFNNLKRIAHVGIIYKVTPEYIITIEGNTNDALSREGDGVYKKKRIARQVYAVANYIQDDTK